MRDWRVCAYASARWCHSLKQPKYISVISINCSFCFLHTHLRVHVRPYRNLTVRTDFLLAARPWFSITSPFPCPGPGAKQSTTRIKHPQPEPTKRGYYGTSIMASRLFSSRLKFGRTTSLAAEQHVICEPVWKHVADLSELLFLNRRQLLEQHRCCCNFGSFCNSEKTS